MDKTVLQRMIAGSSRRSPVFEWLDQHFLDIVEGRGDRLAISWVELAAYMEANAILDGDGKVPTPRRLARTWQAVKDLRRGQPGEKRPRGRPAKNAQRLSAELAVACDPAKPQALAVFVPSAPVNIGPAPAILDGRASFKPGSRVAKSVEENIEQSRAAMRAQDAWVGDLSQAERRRQEMDRRVAIENARAEGENKI